MSVKGKALSESLAFWRAERPDEWTMDEFIRDAAELEAKYKALGLRFEQKEADFDVLAEKYKTLEASKDGTKLAFELHKGMTKQTIKELCDAMDELLKLGDYDSAETVEQVRREAKTILHNARIDK